MKKKFILFLTLEIAVTLSVILILIFKIIENRNFAGLFAGSLFTGLGTYILFEILKTKKPFKFFSFYSVTIHLFFSALPLIISRILSWGTPHAELLIFGLEAPLFHKIAEKIFVILILCTLIDLVRTFTFLKTK